MKPIVINCYRDGEISTIFNGLYKSVFANDNKISMVFANTLREVFSIKNMPFDVEWNTETYNLDEIRDRSFNLGLF